MKLYISGNAKRKTKVTLKYCGSIAFISFLFAMIFVSCKKFVKVDPPKTVLISNTVFTSDASATSAVIGIYSKMMETPSLASIVMTIFGGLSSDELINYSSNTAQAEVYFNTLTPSNSSINSLWGNAYQYIYAANRVIEGLAKSTSVSASVKQQLTGEAKFIRAFCHFYLVNLFGDVPLITSTDYNANSIASRTPKAEVYLQIIKDLKDAQNLLGDNYVKNDNASTSERVRPNKWAATGLLSRVYLYLGDWINAETQSTSIINNVSKYSLVSNSNDVFLKNSTEAIWQLMAGRPDMNTWEGNIFILTVAPCCAAGSAISNQLINAFEPGDNRKSNWINSITISGTTYYYPYKYKVRAISVPMTEYYMVLRLAEQYLIRAEARAQQNNIPGSQTDLNGIRNRAGLSGTTAGDKTSLLLAIEQERKVELFAEWGHRWLDLKRTNRADVILGPIKIPNWQPTDVLYPIPQNEINNDPNLTQNTGY